MEQPIDTPSTPTNPINLSQHVVLSEGHKDANYSTIAQLNQLMSPSNLSDAALLDISLSLKKRDRTSNWANEEKKMLLELCRQDITVVENKRLDADLSVLKNRAWTHIHRQFSAAFGPERNVNRLKEQWRRMKAFARSEVSEYHLRLSAYGQQAADLKRPSQLTFDVWHFLLEAKKACRNEFMEGVDYSKMLLKCEMSQGTAPPLQKSPHDEIELGNSNETKSIDNNNQDSDEEFCDNSPSSSKSQHENLKRPYTTAFSEQNESMTNESIRMPDDTKMTHNDYHPPSIGGEEMPSFAPSGIFDQMGALQYLQQQAAMLNNVLPQNRPMANPISVKKDLMMNPVNGNGHANVHINGHTNGHSNGHTNGHINGHINGHTNGHTTGINSNYPNYPMQAPPIMPFPPAQVPIMNQPSVAPMFADLQHQIIEMQIQEHGMRMQVLKWQLQKARDDCDTSEINKMLAQRKLRMAANISSKPQDSADSSEE